MHDSYVLVCHALLKFYGITRNPKTAEYMMFWEYAKHGNLRSYLEKNFLKLKWREKLEMLRKIINDLFEIHSLKLVHKDLHGGNILNSYTGYFGSKISDLGLSQLINDSNPSANIYGVLPYMAPEILDKNSCTFASNIYSFGIIMIEVSTGKPPYTSVSHDERLALAICNGLRPRVARGTPKCFIDLIN